MPFVYFLLFVTFLATTEGRDLTMEQIESRSFVDDIIFEKMRWNIIHGDPLTGIPPMDPFVIENDTLDLNTSFGMINLGITDASLNHLSEFVVEKFKTNVFMRKLSWAIRFPVIRFMGNYKLNGTFLDMVPVKDIDSFSIEVVNATVTTDTRLNLGLASLMSNSFKMKMTLEEVQIKFKSFVFPSMKNILFEFNLDAREVDFDVLFTKKNREEAISTVLDEVIKSTVTKM